MSVRHLNKDLMNPCRTCWLPARWNPLRYRSDSIARTVPGAKKRRGSIDFPSVGTDHPAAVKGGSDRTLPAAGRVCLCQRDGLPDVLRDTSLGQVLLPLRPVAGHINPPVLLVTAQADRIHGNQRTLTETTQTAFSSLTSHPPTHPWTTMLLPRLWQRLWHVQ